MPVCTCQVHVTACVCGGHGVETCLPAGGRELRLNMKKGCLFTPHVCCTAQTTCLAWRSQAGLQGCFLVRLLHNVARCPAARGHHYTLALALTLALWHGTPEQQLLLQVRIGSGSNCADLWLSVAAGQLCTNNSSCGMVPTCECRCVTCCTSTGKHTAQPTG